MICIVDRTGRSDWLNQSSLEEGGECDRALDRYQYIYVQDLVERAQSTKLVKYGRDSNTLAFHGYFLKVEPHGFTNFFHKWLQPNPGSQIPFKGLKESQQQRLCEALRGRKDFECLMLTTQSIPGDFTTLIF